MKTIIKISKSAILIIILVCVSCTNLDMEVSGVINPTNFPKTEIDAKAMVTACYVPFRSNWYQGIFTVNNQGYQIIGDMTTDLGDCQWAGDKWNAPIYQNWNSDTYVVTFFYEFVRDLNEFTIVIDKLHKMDINDNVKKRSNAEVKCARGFMSYLMYSWFGPVSIATIEQLQTPLSNEVVVRPTDDEMVAFIEKDLKEAAADLEYKYSDSEFGRFTKGLANTLLLKLYMLDKQWEKAVQIGHELADSRYGYNLVTSSYADIFTYDNQRNNEIIFASTCDRKNAQLWLAHVLPSVYPTKNTRIVKWGGYRVPWKFYSTFESNDNRLETLIGSFTGTNGVTYSKTNPGTVLRIGAIPVKYGEDPNALGEESSIDWIVYRYADVLTLLSEAIVRNGNSVTQEAIDLLNLIRNRAGLVGYEFDRYSSNGVVKFLEDILLERGHEFWFEGLRREDLIRHGKYKSSAIDKGSTTAQDWFVRMPLPQKVINEGKGKIHQNLGY
jgi:hypothetical protein